MGEIINVRCRDCKRQWQCFTGNGLQHSRKEVILAAFSDEDRKQAERLMEAGGIPAYDFQYRLAVCGHCQNIVAVPVLRMPDSDEVFVGRCPLCGETAGDLCGEEQSAEEWGKKAACPVCRCQRLEVEAGGFWD